jgi:TATA-binding protein-associated factor
MSDPLVYVRKKAAHCFGKLIALLPLAQGCPLPEGLDEQQRIVCERDREFLSQLLDSKKVEDYELPVQLSVSEDPSAYGSGFPALAPKLMRAICVT